MAINRGSIRQQITKPGLTKRLTKTSGKKNGKKKLKVFTPNNRLY